MSLMKTHRVNASARSSANPQAVWDLLADVTTWPSWTAFSETSYEREGDPSPHGVGAVRRLRMGRLRSKEQVLVFEPTTRFSYDYTGSLPFDRYVANVTLTPSATGTTIEWGSEFEAKWPLTGGPLRLFMTFVLGDIAKRLARAAEGPTP